jgi:predicted DNA-binding transcriptional regulator YafY
MPPRRTKSPRPGSGPITSERAARLYRLLSLLKERSKSRSSLISGLRLDSRGFYRDLKTLRSLGVRIDSTEHRYRLGMRFDQAVSRLPFPDPQLNLHEAIQLSRGKSLAHQKLRKQIRRIVGRK